jgi:tetratricopeptide (TPR) repeat protein
MKILKHFPCLAVLFTAALLSASLSAHAGDIEDANKLFKQGQLVQALDKVNGFLAANPKDAQARFLKGLILTEQGQNADAIKIFSALTQDYPDLPEPYNNLAVLYASQGQYDKAKILLEKAISTHPSYATAHENLGDIYAKMASQAYDRALQLDQGNAATQTKLAMIQNLFAGGTGNDEINAPEPAKAEQAVPGKTEATPVMVEKKHPEPPPSVSATQAATIAKAHQVEDKPETRAETKTQTQTESSAGTAKAIEPVIKKDNNKEITETVMAWAAAWSSQNTGNYLSFYADDFKTPGGETRAAWEALRRERVTTPKYIHVGIAIKSITFTDSTHATVKFRQAYRASHLKSTDNKTLLMVKSGDKWLIHAELSR